ncbi:MAG: FecR domain-containing protein [Planctomycetes bacterium]|nr:FecR domain-containing protein [Planctomycetota bacterium]
MTTPTHEELEALLARLEQNDLDEVERKRLGQLLCEDELLDAAVDQLEMQALLRWHHGASTAAIEVAESRVSTRLRLLLAAAAILLVVGTAFLTLRESTRDDSRSESFVTEGGVAPVARSERLPSGWEIRPTGDAQYSVDGAQRILLTRGELLVRSTTDDAEPLDVETTLGTARARGTEFYIGNHALGDATSLVRVLVMAGTVVLENTLGNASGSAGELLSVAASRAPELVVADSGADFGFDLYRELVRENPNASLFFSPYSITNVLTMAAEGARGATADEFARVLHWPESARRIGNDAQRIPFELANIRSGYRTLNRRFSEHDSPAQEQLARRARELNDQIVEVGRRIDAARAANDDRAWSELERQAGALRNQYYQAARKIKSYRLDIANAVWAEQSAPISPRYLDTIRSAFEPEAIVAADFVNEAPREVARINDWVRTKTKGRIPSLVDEQSIRPLTRLVLLNAIHFFGEWKTPFDPGMTQIADFTLPHGATVQVPLMRNYGLEDCRYGAFEADGAFFRSPKMITRGQTEGCYPGPGGLQIVELPYRGDDLSMVLLLPRDAGGLDALEQRLTAPRLRRWLRQLEKRETKVLVPRFEGSLRFELAEALKRLGLQRAFRDPSTSDGADFSGMLQSDSLEDALRVEQVVHRAFVSVDEKGTEAAAATAMIMSDGATMPDDVPFVPYFRADHAFLYLIRDVKTGVILFLGRVTRP